MRRTTILLGSAAAASAALAQAPTLLAHILPGQWSVHEIGTRTPARSLCVRSVDQLIQLHHPGQSCARFVVDSSPNAVTVHYTCRGAGYGRTTLSSDGDGIARVQTQGIAGGQPFDVDYEARRTGACR